MKTTLSAFALIIFLSSPAMAGFIDFEGDSIGTVANGFASTSDSGVHFTDTSGSNLQIHTHQALGTKNLLVFNDDASKLQIDFDFSIDSLSLFFGNDDACCSSAGDLAWLEIFNGGSLVNSTSVLMNRNDFTDQSISISAGSFDSALFWYGDTNGAAINLIEAVDNISFNAANAVPEPASLALLGLGLAGIGFSRKRKTT
jgi:hypothetical protein